MQCRYKKVIIKREAVTYTKQTAEHVKHQQCSNEAGVTGWCSEHTHSHDFIMLGETVGFARVPIPALGFTLPRGRDAWEEYAETLPRPGEQNPLSKRHTPPVYGAIVDAIRRFHREMFPSREEIIRQIRARQNRASSDNLTA